MFLEIDKKRVLKLTKYNCLYLKIILNDERARLKKLLKQIDPKNQSHADRVTVATIKNELQQIDEILKEV